MNNPPDHSSQLKSFWTTKILNYLTSKWGYSSLTFPISIHLDLLGCMPLSPTWRYLAFLLHEFLTVTYPIYLLVVKREEGVRECNNLWINSNIWIPDKDNICIYTQFLSMSHRCMHFIHSISYPDIALTITYVLIQFLCINSLEFILTLTHNVPTFCWS